jgi:hypothetical protein
MIYFYYNDLLQPSDHLDKSKLEMLTDFDKDNFIESLGKKFGYQFNCLINILNLENIPYDVIKGFNYISDDREICNFEKISFEFNNSNDINDIIDKYGLDGIFNIDKENNNYTFIIKH